MREDDLAKAMTDDSDYIAQTLANCLPAPNVDEEILPRDRPSTETFSFDLDQLVQLRFDHQTKQAKSGVRTNGTQALSANLTERQSLLREFHRSMKEVDDSHEGRGVGTGLERSARWRESGTLRPTAGNAANALESATARNKKVSPCVV